jgi:hypothetical protein
MQSSRAALHRCSFGVTNPYLRVATDETNVCNKQLLDIGFSPDRCSAIIPQDLKHATVSDYTLTAILHIHESFLVVLKRPMPAIVDIC